MYMKKAFRTGVDIAMTAVTILLMGFQRTGLSLHIFLGFTLLFLTLIHNGLNLSWWAALGRGQYNRCRWTRTVLNILLLADLAALMVSGMAFAVGIHRILALLFLVLVAVHASSHGKYFFRRVRN